MIQCSLLARGHLSERGVHVTVKRTAKRARINDAPDSSSGLYLDEGIFR
jgi:hypothetical protein